ncbi:tRNA 2-selenouridine(34) synthase MnmH [Psychromonas aquimarina]|uniref:tRNA 2-selenouridine(34) synthase MnmH n=1 Tax=Psychromonas aquimarina TaxID=444919 RepID=UPI0003FB5095|nr:tRNA 2-selenouridine(34) synthase MnmH [Psychromonas aquimarina]
MNQTDQQLFRSLLLSDTPFIDLRAPVEFLQGAFPGSVNLPLMTDRERQLVGTCYKNSGQEAAIVLGHQLVEHDIQNRINAWAEFKQTNPGAWLYCFRGGLRSRLSTQFLKDKGTDINIVPGGYKALRRYLIEVIEQACEQPLIIVGGNTGCGKTLLIQELDNGLDIEGRANHRGSSFGKQVTPQPKQISYENQLAVDILRIFEHSSSLVIEDESQSIGTVHVPLPLFSSMKTSPMVVVDDPFEVRLERLRFEYCTSMTEKFIRALGEEAGWQAYDEYLHRGIYGIRKRLGLEKFNTLNVVLEEALKQQKTTGSTQGHLNWITQVLNDYYDPMYRFQLDKKAERIQFKGTYQEVKDWLTAKRR